MVELGEVLIMNNQQNILLVLLIMMINTRNSGFDCEEDIYFRIYQRKGWYLSRKITSYYF